MKCCMHAEWSVNFKNYNQIFDLRLRISYGTLKFSLYREAIRLQCFAPMRYVSARGHANI